MKTDTKLSEDSSRARDYRRARERAQAVRIQSSIDQLRSTANPQSCVSQYDVSER